MAASQSSTSTTVTETETSPRLRLKLKKPRSDKKVKWTNETVDNEHMGKKKSKCCCIYEKPRMFGESSSEDEDDECGHCRGHKKKCYQDLPSDGAGPSENASDPGAAGGSGS